MPPLKQPVPLRDLAMDAMITFFANYFYERSSDGSLDKIRQGIDAMKNDICPLIPTNLSADFHEKFMKKFIWSQESPVKLPESHARAVLKILMDRKIVGLRCTDKMLASLDPGDAGRILRLKELDMCFPMNILLHHSIEIFQLEDITTINFGFYCSDAVLEGIGRNCRKLESLDATCSYKLTDGGLRGLSPCAELRSVSFVGCRGISHNAIVKFLSQHKKIKALSAWAWKSAGGFNGFSQSDSQAYSDINFLRIGLESVSSDNLHTIVVKFPNLTSLRVSGKIAGDLTILKSLGKLSKLDLSSSADFTRGELKKLLILIGVNLRDLRLGCGSSQACVTQNQLNFVFKYCGNLERLEFDYYPRLLRKNLVIPPFQKLKILQCLISRQYSDCFIQLEFDRMAKLEQLTIFRSYMTDAAVKEMILDNVKFPNLKLIQMHEVSGNYDINHIRKIARDNNLDFHITNQFMFE